MLNLAETVVRLELAVKKVIQLSLHHNPLEQFDAFSVLPVAHGFFGNLLRNFLLEIFQS